MDGLLIAGHDLDMGGKGRPTQTHDTGIVDRRIDILRIDGLIGFLRPLAAIKPVPEGLSFKLFAFALDGDGLHVTSVGQGGDFNFLNHPVHRAMQRGRNIGLAPGNPFAEVHRLPLFHQGGAGPADMLQQGQEHFLWCGYDFNGGVGGKPFALGRVHPVGKGTGSWKRSCFGSSGKVSF